MEHLGTYVIYVIMAFVMIGAIAAVRNEEEGMGKEFIQGIHTIGPIFIPIAATLASIPYLSKFIEFAFGPLFSAIGADPAMAATTLISSDMGSYQLADVLASDRENWIIATVNGIIMGPHIIFTIPVALAMLQKRDHKYLALGMMSGVLTVPISVFITTSILALTETKIRDTISTTAEPTYQLSMSIGTILINLIPLTAVGIFIAVGLRMFPNLMIKGFMAIGWFMSTAMKLVLACTIVEYFTGVFTAIFGHWGFDPIIADAKDQFRGLEIAGYIGIMLAGAFPMVYAIQKYLAKPLQFFGKLLGLSSIGSAGVIAATANPLALFKIIKDMPAKDKVLTIAYAISGGWMIGDQLAFPANFQPTIIIPVMAGKFLGAVLAILLCYWISIPKALELERIENLENRAKKNEKAADPNENPLGATS
ncbi:ethanolamine utilization protein EutH [Pseudobacillus wudalianchiensis]|uniref:Ethanolamine utilization protein EutH n=1 Tax=Pseudobacillus wudalianchiensis TaxID=1743143 RepID=A0A1B9ATK9_9BACI|nr:ethanolamine utilization protein EutH [Bacillus wudalianchiensis]OCA87230.1 ethanolamine utilization protein EutH [Bacillus wudalianchiensis]